jgi:hypothetical protein
VEISVKGESLTEFVTSHFQENWSLFVFLQYSSGIRSGPVQILHCMRSVILRDSNIEHDLDLKFSNGWQDQIMIGFQYLISL